MDLLDCGIGNRRGNIYVNEDLPPATRRLYQKARELRKHGFKYVWCEDGQVFFRKTDQSNIIKIGYEGQISEMITQTDEKE